MMEIPAPSSYALQPRCVSFSRTDHNSPWLTVYNSLSEAKFFLCLAVMPSLITPLRKASPESKVTHAIPELPVNSVPCLSQSYPAAFQRYPQADAQGGYWVKKDQDQNLPVVPHCALRPGTLPPPTYQMAIYGRENQEGV